MNSNIQKAIADKKLQAALDKNAAQRLMVRTKAYQALPEDFVTLQKKAHAIRSDVISNLDQYLNQFITNATKNGIIIHQANDAEQARKIILKIVKEKNARLIAKSKTMMSEEIVLNSALENIGIEVVETDLGEYIVQLRGEHPSHIITPAVHLRRADVGQTFHEKLGIPLTDDIQTLTNVARGKLRQTFLDADIGISGVNFGIAETGGICLLTNEGNGRMVTALPKVHIALMGIERLAPNMEALSHLITMLPRSATGQKITVYTQFIHGPRKSDEIDGAEERHLILIDNGRRQIRNSPLAQTLLCIRCGACINACPVFREIGGYAYTSKTGEYTPYPGPIGSTLSPALFGQTDFGHLAQASTLCGACKEACPVDIDLPKMLLRVRAGGINLTDAEQESHHPVGISAAIRMGLRIFTWISTRPKLFAFSQKLAALLGRIWSPKKTWMVLPGFSGWRASKDFPKPAKKSFRARWKGVQQNSWQTNNEIIQIQPPKANTSLSREFPTKQKDADLIIEFENEFAALGGHFTRCSQEALAQKILDLLIKKTIGKILSWDAEQLPKGLVVELEKSGIQIEYGSHPEIRAGLTGVQAAISETGSILVTAGPGRPLSTSLLPEIHIAVLQEAKIYKNLPQVFNLQEIQPVSSAVLISGPSRTADIEMTLTIGVHGPGEIYIFCIP